MAFVRIRKGCAQLLATRYLGNGRSAQVLVARLPGYFVSTAEQQAIEAKFPDLHFDWAAINRALARGDKRELGPPGPYLGWAEVEHLLRALARREREHDGFLSEIHTWRRRPRCSPACAYAERHGLWRVMIRANLTSDDRAHRRIAIRSPDGKSAHFAPLGSCRSGNWGSPVEPVREVRWR